MQSLIRWVAWQGCLHTRWSPAVVEGARLQQGERAREEGALSLYQLLLGRVNQVAQPLLQWRLLRLLRAALPRRPAAACADGERAQNDANLRRPA